MAANSVHQIIPSHVALLVPSVRKAADHLATFGFRIGDEEVWEGEGTREIYVEGDKSNSLLLMEPAKPGAYERALKKRGPGLHHLAIDVLDIDSFIDSLSGSGWLLQPASLKTLKRSRTVYLARPGFPALIEVQEKDELLSREPFVTNVALPFEALLTRLLAPVGLSSLVTPSSALTLTCAGSTIKFGDLL